MIMYEAKKNLLMIKRLVTEKGMNQEKIKLQSQTVHNIAGTDGEELTTIAKFEDTLQLTKRGKTFQVIFFLYFTACPKNTYHKELNNFLF